MKHAFTFTVAIIIGVFVGAKFADKIPFVKTGA